MRKRLGAPIRSPAAAICALYPFCFRGRGSMQLGWAGLWMSRRVVWSVRTVIGTDGRGFGLHTTTITVSRSRTYIPGGWQRKSVC
jgi:hypothetical protein